MRRFNRTNILSFALGFVVLWFGYQELTSPESWIGLVPPFLSDLVSAKYLVLGHGLVLVLGGIALVFDFHRRLAAVILALLLGQIVFSLFMSSGLNEVTVRDIGLLGMAIAIAVRN